MRAELERNLRRVQVEIAGAALQAGRAPEDIRLVAVTKSAGSAAAEVLARLGQLDLGESRVDVLEEKHAHLARSGVPVRWHLVGHLQRNKAGRAVALADEIHSVDSMALLQTIDRVAGDQGRKPAVYLQVLLSGEPTKHGFDPGELVDAVDAAAELDHVELAGLMTMAPLLDDPDEMRRAAEEVFARLADLALELPALAFVSGEPRLSMGMSGDFREAIAAGAHLVRVGSALFEGIDAG